MMTALRTSFTQEGTKTVGLARETELASAAFVGFEKRPGRPSSGRNGLDLGSRWLTD
jgi:hypothetical protein